jgi:DNA-binding NtrC family response regulator
MDHQTSSLIGTSEHIADVRTRIARLARRRSTVSVVGGSGTGKSLVAAELHRHSGREGKFVRISAAQLDEEVFYSVLAGHLRGAFTGAHRDHEGLIEHAKGGTVFFDDVQDTHAKLQAFLLDVLERQPMRAVGAPREFKLDARIIVGLQRPASELVKTGRLRPDLAYRLDVVRIELLPLRDHVEDVDVLVPHLLERIAAAEGLPISVVTPAAMRALRRYGWPGNVRELEAVLTEAMAAGQDVSDDCIELDDLRPEVRTAAGVRSAAAGISPEEIREVLDGTGGNVAAAARQLDVHPRTMWRWVKAARIVPRER